MTFRMTGIVTFAMLLGLATSGAALAHGHGDRGQVADGCSGLGMAMQGKGMMPGGMMDQMGSGMMQMHGQMMGSGMMGPLQESMMSRMGGGMMAQLDQDGDGEVTAAEVRSGLSAKLSEYDVDGDGTLSIAEFETLHTAMIREVMVDRFQHLDADGDGQVTDDEMTAPANRIERMQQMRERMMERRGNMPMKDGGGMMKDN
ncbi:EF hand [Salinihabitans flavidus]|uniref:EF hand n=1 Tax=Salinihabitans flavidus TaxID=569882 RepID=A0A1H8WGP3_9RHOB|nr:hypothetical protein [Salinihabitans flavidus]SEP26822.1 EF hand [Salinihabitans flavidus]